MLQTFKKFTLEVLAEIAEEKKVRKTNELFLLFSMGSQFDHLIKQKLDALGVFCLVADPACVKADDVKKLSPIGIILSGGPASAYELPPFDAAIFDLDIPVFGICLGFQMWAYHIGVPVTLSHKREFGTHTLILNSLSPLFDGLPKESKVMETHGDIINPNEKLEIIGTTDNTPVAAGHYKNLWGVQFHPEVTETEYGDKIYENFCFKICGAKDKFPASEVAKTKIEDLRLKIKDKKVLLALSGGTDSSVVAYLLKAACSVPIHGMTQEPINRRATIQAIYIKGIDRPDDEAHVHKYFGNQPWITVKVVDATENFLKALAGKAEMPEKRIAMRGIYKEILETEAKNFGANFIAQGTLFTDVSESGGGYDTGSKKAQIKLHHNVNLGFYLPEIEPLIDCVKDTGRQLGRSIGVPEELLLRQPFPGPGLVVRIEGEVTAEKLLTARKIDGIYIEEMRKWELPLAPSHSTNSGQALEKRGELRDETKKTSLYNSIWQAGAVVTNSWITCTKGDDAAMGHVVALWAVWSVNGFTARSAELPYDFLKHVSQRMTNEIREVGGVVYRLSDKPPVTIEWG